MLTWQSTLAILCVCCQWRSEQTCLVQSVGRCWHEASACTTQHQCWQTEWTRRQSVPSDSCSYYQSYTQSHHTHTTQYCEWLSFYLVDQSYTQSHHTHTTHYCEWLCFYLVDVCVCYMHRRSESKTNAQLNITWDHLSSQFNQGYWCHLPFLLLAKRDVHIFII